METSQTTWSSGTGSPHGWSDVLEDIRSSIEAGARIFVGADSVKEQKECTFVVTVFSIKSTPVSIQNIRDCSIFFISN